MPQGGGPHVLIGARILDQVLQQATVAVEGRDQDAIQRLRDALARRPDKVPRSFAAIVDTLTDFSPREVLHAPVKRLLTLFSFFPNHIVNHGDSQEYAGAQPVFAAGFDFGPLTADEKEYANIMLFEDYDDAVRVEVCLLDDWRKEGLF